MRQALFVATAVLALASTPALALTAYLDYDKDYDFSKVQTYQWITSKVAATYPQLDRRIVSAIDQQLAVRGKRPVDSDPDIYITYYANTREELSINTTDIVPSGWRWHSRYGTATTIVNSDRVGTLIIDATDAKTRKLIWRGTAEDTVNADPDHIDEKKITRALEKLGKLWDRRFRAPS